jgi:iron(III) transport system substrate-binding protein
VVVYCSVDEAYAKPLLNELQARSGLQIDAIYDVEAAKTAGLVSRIRAESARPQADVLWSSALLQTLLLQRSGLLQPYQSPEASDIPNNLKDPGGAWTTVGVRIHAIGTRPGQKQPPRSLDELAAPRYKGRIGISNPLFGTGTDCAAALGATRGIQATLKLYRKLMANGLRVLPGNSVVADGVARGELVAGVADSDDWATQRTRGGGTAMLQNEAAMPVPGSVALIKNAPHPAAARQLIDALVSARTEARLTQLMPGVYAARNVGAHMPPGAPAARPLPAALRARLPRSYGAWPAAWNALREPLADIVLNN